MTNVILYINSVPYLGGAEISLLTLAANLDPALYVPHLITTADGPLAQRAKALDIPVSLQTFPWLSRRRPWIYAGSIWQLVHTLRRHDVRLIHTNCPRCLPHVRAAGRLTGVPYVSHVRDLRAAWFEQGRLAALNHAQRVIANSQYIATCFADADVDAEKIEVIYNPIDVADFADGAGRRETMRRTLGIPPDAFLIGMVGQIQESKGHILLVESAPTVLATASNVHFVVVGAASTPEARAYEREVQAKITGAGLERRFHFTGFRDDVPAIMHALDVLVLASHAEAFGRVVVEALAAGCPVVATSVGGVPEIMTDEREGLLVPPRDAAVLGAALVCMATNEDFRAACGLRGPATAQRFTPDRHVHQIQRLYTELCPRSRVQIGERGAVR